MTATPAVLLLFGLGWLPLPLVVVTDPDERALRSAGIDCGTDSLIAFLGRLSPDQPLLARIDALVSRLGAEKFAERTAAYRELVRIGPAARPALLKAEQNPSAEIRRGAGRCLDEPAFKTPLAERAAAAIRLLVKRNAPGAIAPMLDYLPMAEANSELETAIAFRVDQLAARSKAAPPELVAALADANPAWRAIAACIVGRRGTAEQQGQVRRLLKDSNVNVRLRAAQGLLAGGHNDAVPALIVLLDAKPTYLAWQAEELLRWVAAGTGPHYPNGLYVGSGGDQATKCRVAWEKWWREQKETLDFAAIVRQPRRPFLFAMGWPIDFLFRPNAYGSDGMLRFHFQFAGTDAVGQFLPNGRLLAATPDYGEPPIFKEMDWSGTVHREFRPGIPRFEPALLERLSDGRTHIMARNNKFAVNEKGIPIIQAGHHMLLDEKGGPIIPAGRAQPFLDPAEFGAVPERPTSGLVTLLNGNRLVLDPRRERLLELDRGGREVGETWCWCNEGSRLYILFPLLRIGFDDLPGRDFDLRTSVDARIRQLESANVLDWYLAAKAIPTDFKSNGAAFPELARALRNVLVNPSGGRRQTGLLLALRAVSDDPIRDAERLADSADPMTRAAAIDMLGESEWKDQQLDLRCAAIKRALRDSSALVRYSAASSARIFRDRQEGVLRHLNELLKDEEEPVFGKGTVAQAAKFTLDSFPRLPKAATGTNPSQSKP